MRLLVPGRGSARFGSYVGAQIGRNWELLSLSQEAFAPASGAPTKTAPSSVGAGRARAFPFRWENRVRNATGPAAPASGAPTDMAPWPVGTSVDGFRCALPILPITHCDSIPVPSSRVYEKRDAVGWDLDSVVMLPKD